jgi:hypothetical protein
METSKHKRRFLQGDIIIFCGFGSVHGVRQWRSPWQRRIVIMSYVSNSLGWELPGSQRRQRQQLLEEEEDEKDGRKPGARL